MNISALMIDITLWGSVAVLGFMAWQRGRVVLVSSMREGSRRRGGAFARAAGISTWL